MVETETPLQRLRQLEAQELAAKSTRTNSTGEPSAPVQKRKRGVVGAILAAIAFALTKAKLLLGALKLGPLLQTFSTMGVSMWIYAGFYGAPLAIGMVVLILVHEYGHG